MKASTSATLCGLGALVALSACAIELDVRPLDTREPALPPLLDELALGPATQLFTGGGGLRSAVSVASDGTQWLIVSTTGEVQTRDDAGVVGSAWRLPDLEGQVFHELPGSHQISVAGTSFGYLFAWTTPDGSARLVRALADGTVFESTIFANAGELGQSRAIVASAGDGAWLAIESCPEGHAPWCIVRSYYLSLDAVGHRMDRLVCDGCSSGPTTYDVVQGSTVLAGHPDGAVVGWSDGARLSFGALGLSRAGPVVVASEVAPERPRERLLTAVHGDVVSVAWRDGADVVRRRVDPRTGEASAMERIGAVGRLGPVLVPIGADVALLTDVNQATLVGPSPELLDWAPACVPVASVEGPANRTLLLCAAFDYPSLFEVSRTDARDITPDFATASTLPDVALACDAWGCSLASHRRSRTAIAPWSFGAPVGDEERDIDTMPLIALARTEDAAYVALGDTVAWSTRSVARIDASGTSTVLASVDVGALAIAPAPDPGAVLLAHATSVTDLGVSSWRGVGPPELSGVVQVTPPSDSDPCTLRTHDCWLATQVAVAGTDDGGWILLWVDEDAHRVSFAVARPPFAERVAPHVLARTMDTRAAPALVVLDGASALAAWEESSPSGELSVRTLVIDASAEAPRASPATVSGRAPVLVRVDDVGLLAWQDADGSVRLTRLDVRGQALDPTGPEALVLPQCDRFGLAAVATRLAAVWCQEAHAISVRLVFLPEHLR